jgi:hypothetical protein
MDAIVDRFVITRAHEKRSGRASEHAAGRRRAAAEILKVPKMPAGPMGSQRDPPFVYGDINPTTMFNNPEAPAHLRRPRRDKLTHPDLLVPDVTQHHRRLFREGVRTTRDLGRPMMLACRSRVSARHAMESPAARNAILYGIEGRRQFTSR